MLQSIPTEQWSHISLRKSSIPYKYEPFLNTSFKTVITHVITWLKKLQGAYESCVLNAGWLMSINTRIYNICISPCFIQAE